MAAGTMDFSYFNSAPLPYPYFGAQQQTAQQQPPPPPPQNGVRDGDFQFDEYNNVPTEAFNHTFTHFQDTFNFEDTAVPVQRQTSTRPTSQSYISQPPVSPVQNNFDGSGFARSDINDDMQRPRSSSEEKDNATPQQNKRKAQNRAAQRAFRERKEKHLKDLEAKLADLQKQSMSLDSENERLRKELAKVATENEILKATANGQAPLGVDSDEIFDTMGFKSAFGHKLDRDDISNRIKFNPLQTIVIDDNSGEPLLNARDTWDYILNHELHQKGLVDVGDVVETVKRMARCHGQGPVFRESDIRKAIDESAVAGGRDELI